MTELWQSRGLVRTLVERDLRARYKRTFLPYCHRIESAAELTALDSGVVGVSAGVSGPDVVVPVSHEVPRIDLSCTACDRRPAIVCLGVSEGSAAPVFSLRREINLAEGYTHTGCSIRSLGLPRGRYLAWGMAVVADTPGEPRRSELVGTASPEGGP